MNSTNSQPETKEFNQKSTNLPMKNLSLLDCMVLPLGERKSARSHRCKEEIDKASSSADKIDGRILRKQGISRSSSIVPSKSIPITNIKRTPSEVQLHEDEQIADHVDYCFFLRLVNGINCRRDLHLRNDRLRRSMDQSIASIMRTRNLPVFEDKTSEPPWNTANIDGYHRHYQRRGSKEKFLSHCTTAYRDLHVSGLEDDRDEGIFILDME